MLKYSFKDVIYYPILIVKLIFQHVKYKNQVKINKHYYGSDKTQYIYFNIPKEIKKNHIIFFVNGSSWSLSNMFIYKFIASFLAVFGYVSVIVSHRLVPKYTYPSQIEDAVCAIKLTQEIANKHNLAKQIIFMGYSSGAQIVTLLAYSHYLEQHGLSKDMISGVMSISGPINFYECKEKHIVNTIINYVSTLSNKESADPYTHLQSNHLIPIFCIHGKKDEFVKPANSETFIKKVNELDPGKGKLQIIENYYHFNILQMFIFPDYNLDIIEWLDQIDRKD